MLPFYASMLVGSIGILLTITLKLSPHTSRVLSDVRSKALSHYKQNEPITTKILPQIHDALHLLKSHEERMRKSTMRCKYSCVAIAILAIIGLMMDFFLIDAQLFGDYTQYVLHVVHGGIVAFSVVLIVYILSPVNFVVAHHFRKKEK